MSGGGGGGGNTQSTSYQTNVPQYAQPYMMDMLGKASALTNINNNPYQTYQGERTAQFTPLQGQAFQGAQNLGPVTANAQGQGLAAAAGNLAMAGSNYQPINAQAYTVNANPQLNTYQMGPAQQVGTSSFTAPGAAQNYMNPYMQNVVDVQQREAQRTADIARTQRGAQAVGAGAFGGSRQAIMDAEANRNLATQLGDIQATGLNSAYQQAQGQFNAEQQARQQAAMANQQAGLTTGQQNLQAALGVQQLGTQAGLQGAMANQQAMMDAQKMYEQSRQFGADATFKGSQGALEAANTLGALGGQQFEQQKGAIDTQYQLGTGQQQAVQSILDQRYADFNAQQNYPYTQLAFMSDLLRGTGNLAATSNVYQNTPTASPLSTMAGLGMGIYGASKMAAGGLVKSRKAGLADLALDNMRTLRA